MHHRDVGEGQGKNREAENSKKHMKTRKMPGTSREWITPLSQVSWTSLTPWGKKERLEEDKIK